MTFHAISMQYPTASASVLEQAAFTETSCQAALVQFKKQYPQNECLILSTCNRVEVYVKGDSEIDLLNFLCQQKNLEPKNIKPFIHHFHGDQAIVHLIQVASGLKSLVIGEPEIFGQIKKAFQLSEKMACHGAYLKQLMPWVFQTVKAIRSQTAVGKCPVSVAYMATKMAKQAKLNIENARLAIIGAGDTAKALMTHLEPDCFKHPIHLFNRTLSHAKKLANNRRIEVFPLEQLPHLLDQYHIIISAVSSPNHILSQQDLIKTPANKAGLLLIDLGMPRNLDPNLAKQDNVQLLCMDDFNTQIEKGHVIRQNAMEQADHMIHQAMSNWQKMHQTSMAEPTIVKLRSQFDRLSEQAIQQCLDQLSPQDSLEQVLQHFSYTLKQKMLHQPTVNLKTACQDGDIDLLSATQQLFGIEQQEVVSK